MSGLSPSTAIVAAVGITTSAYIAGGMSILSTVAIPGVLSSAAPADILAKAWAGIFTLGKAHVPTYAGLALASYAYVAYADQRNGSRPRWTLWLSAAALTISIVPFTIIFMASTNDALMSMANGGMGTPSLEATRELMIRWKGLNMSRSMLPLLGAAVALYAFQ